jgi:hypothetical protein
LRRYSDTISEDQCLTGWSFDIQTLNSIAGSYFGRPVHAALFLAFKEIAQGQEMALRNAHFTVWMGDMPNQQLWVAVEESNLPEIKNALNERLRTIPGFKGQSRISLPGDLTLSPRYRYFVNRVKDYSVSADDEDAGRSFLDDSERFGTQLPVFFWGCEDQPCVKKEDEVYDDMV